MTDKALSRLRILAVFLLAFTAMGALPAGYAYMDDPTGNALGVTPELLRHSPFTSFFIPGLVLFTVNGLMNLGAALAAAVHWRGYWYWVMLQGILLGGWVLVQVMMIRTFHWLQALYLAIGALLLWVGWRINSAQKGKA